MIKTPATPAAAPPDEPADLIAKARSWAAAFDGSQSAERLNSRYYVQALADQLEQALSGPPAALRDPSEALVDRMAEAAALHKDFDGCFERVRDWEALDEWEREAHPDERPHDDYEERELWRGRLRAALEAADPARPTELTPTERIAAEVRQERAAQHAHWGAQDHPDGTGPDRQLLNTGRTYAELADAAKARTDAAAASGHVTYADILLEEVLEALAEADPARLRTELIQLAAVGVQWVEAGDRREALPTEGTRK